jgi:hypothetical protein
MELPLAVMECNRRVVLQDRITGFDASMFMSRSVSASGQRAGY